MISSISATQLKEWLDKNEAILIDVREPAEYEADHIARALSMPLSTFDATKLPPANGKKRVFHCVAGIRSAKACAKAQAADPAATLYNFDGGLPAWKAAGFPTQNGNRRCLPLDRQVQLTLGLCLLLSSVLAATGYAFFIWITGLIGLGLIIAGLTGFCGLAMLLARAPWNRGDSLNSCCAIKP